MAVKSLLLFPLLWLAALQEGWGEDLKIATQVLYSRPSVSFQTHPGSGGPQNITTLAPDAEARPGVEIRYRNYGLSFSSSFSDASNGPPRVLAGGLTDVRTFYYGDAWGFEGYNRSAHGFRSEDGEVSHPNMSLRSTSATLYRAAGYDSHVYRMADGMAETGVEPDLMFVFNLSQNRLRDDMNFLQGSGMWDSRFSGVRDLNLYSASAGLGLAVSSNAGGVYFDPALFLGFGAQYREWDGHPQTAFNLAKINLRMRLGYRSRWFDLGGGFENDAQLIMAEGNEDAIFSSLVARAQLQVYL